MARLRVRPSSGAKECADILCVNAHSDPSLRRILADNLAWHLRFGDHSEAAALVATQTVSVLLYVMGRSERDRPDVESLAASPPHIPVILVSRALDADTAIWALRTGLWDCVILPRDLSHLRARLQEAWAGCSARVGAARAVGAEGSTSAPTAEPATAPAVTAIRRRFAEPLRIAELASCCDMSPVTFARRFKLEHGITASEFLKAFRLEHAKRLLKETRLPVKQIAFDAGFNDLAYFARYFKRAERVSPTTFRLSLAEDPRVSFKADTAAQDKAVAKRADRRLT